MQGLVALLKITLECDSKVGAFYNSQRLAELDISDLVFA